MKKEKGKTNCSTAEVKLTLFARRTKRADRKWRAVYQNEIFFSLSRFNSSSFFFGIEDIKMKFMHYSSSVTGSERWLVSPKSFFSSIEWNECVSIKAIEQRIHFLPLNFDFACKYCLFVARFSFIFSFAHRNHFGAYANHKWTKRTHRNPWKHSIHFWAAEKNRRRLNAKQKKSIYQSSSITLFFYFSFRVPYSLHEAFILANDLRPSLETIQYFNGRKKWVLAKQ